MSSLTGHLLVASPQLVDPNFARTVLLLFEHSDQGASGVVLNRATEATITDLSEQVFEEHFAWEKPINLGGPVPGPLLVLHTIEELADQEVLPGVFSTYISSKIQRVIRRRPEPSLIVANCAGWGPGQLERELEQESWVHLPAKPEHLFGDDAGDLWDTLSKAVRSSHLAQFLGLRVIPGDPAAN